MLLASRSLRQYARRHERLLVQASSSIRSPTKENTITTKLTFGETTKAYLDLSKAKLSSFVVISSGAGYLLTGLPVDCTALAATCTGTFLCAASAGTFNQIIEKENDSRMARTLLRPLPYGRVTSEAATAWGVSTAMAGTGLLYSCTNPVVASLGLFNIFLYAGPYTYSKQKTELNTWIGAVVGAVPPVMGWAAASGGSIWAMEPAALAAFLYLWQFPHFFALMWMHRHDYAKGGFKMVSLSDPNGTRTSDLIMKYTLYSTALPIAVSASGMCSWMFAVEGTALNMVWLYFARKFQNERTTKNVRDVFRWSLVYILLGLSGMVFHANSWKLNQDDYYHWAAEKVMTMRAELSGKCVHEILAYRNVNTAASDTVEGKLDSDDSNSDGRVGKAPGLCLKLKTEEAVSSAATVPAALGSKVAIAAQKNRSSSSASNVTPQ